MQTGRSRYSSFATVPAGIGGFFARYSWVIIKNVIGWVLILTALLVGGVFPGPLGTPLFLIGFALVTFPGKRRVTSRVMRGIPIHLQSRRARLGRLAVAILLPPAIVWFLAQRRHPIIHPGGMGLWNLCALYSLSFLGTWFITWLLLLGLNAIIRLVPRMRRRVRPWMKRHGINLLPPRTKRRGPTSPASPPNQEILEIHLTERMKDLPASLGRSARRRLRFWSRRPSP